MAKIAIVGGGVAGGTAALYLSKLNLDVTIFEKNSSLISGPPFCHLHSGGNLYREIDDEQCIVLLHQSIDLLRFYPYAIDYRPTVVVTPKDDMQEPKDIIPRLKKLKNEYQKSIDKDIYNKVLGEVENYYKTYSKEDILALKYKETVAKPSTLDEWMILPSKNIDIEQIKFPIIIVQEYGLNLFRLSAGLNLELEEIQNCKRLYNTKVTNIKKENEYFDVEYKQDGFIKYERFDYIINAAGYLTGNIDDMFIFKRDRFVEFKAAYVTKWDECNDIWPEIIFHGQRGTPQGMGQFTPYPDGHFQLHGMTQDITLFDNGIQQSTSQSAQPVLCNTFIKKIDDSWEESEFTQRTQRAIKHIAKFLPAFSTAKVAAKPLYGAQQIPGLDKDLRAADVTFEGDRYARCEVVKANSVLAMIDEIMKKLIKLEYVDETSLYKRDFNLINFDEETLLNRAQEGCIQRGYPKSLAKINTTKPSC